MHIRIAHSLNMNSRLNALRRFVTLRGCSREIRRECEELAASIKVFNRLNIENFSTHRGISPPEARHMGGSWEKLIRSVGQTFKALFKEQIDDEVPSSIVAKITNVLSNRPLTRNSSDPEDSDAITPNHLLLTSK